MKELKIKLDDWQIVKRNLDSLGSFVKELNVVDTYFDHPGGDVLKLTENEEGNFLIHLKAVNGKFEFVSKDEVDTSKKDVLSEKYGVKVVLKKKQVFYDYKGLNMNFNIIEDLGDFLIAEGEDPTPETFKELGVNNPEFVTKSFAELKLEV